MTFAWLRYLPGPFNVLVGGVRVLPRGCLVESFGAVLRELRLAVGWTQEQLARSSGVSAHTIITLENGKRRPRLSTVTALADALDLAGPHRDRLIAAARAAAEGATGATGTAGDAEGDAGTAAPVTVVARSDLPRAIGDFCGRMRELTHLLAAVDGPAEPAAAPIVALDGMAGVGKTTLAVQAAHALAERFPDGQVFLDLRGHTEGQQPLSPSAALDVLLRAAGVDNGRIPTGAEQKAALWRATVAGRRLLLVLDNASSAKQVRPLLPGSASCAVLVTSRARLTALEGVRTLTLAVLPEPEAVGLLTRVASDRIADPATAPSPAEAQEVVGLCGHLPLAIRIAAARLRHHPSWTVRDLVVRLRAQSDRLDELAVADRAVAGAFALSFEALPAELARLFTLLGLYPTTTITAEPVAALAGTDRGQAARQLEALADSHLLEETAAGQYRFHDLLRQYAAQVARRLPEAERSAALTRLVGWYTDTAHRAAVVIGSVRLIAPGPSPARGYVPLDFDDREPGGRDTAMAWFARERENLASSMATGARLGLHEDVCRLAVAQQHYLILRRHPEEAVATFTLAIASARALGDPRVLARVLCGLGSARFDQSRYDPSHYDEAEAAFQEALERYQSLSLLSEVAGTRLDLACVSAERGDYDGAVDAMTQAYRDFVEVGDLRRQGLCLTNIGELEHRRGNLAEAVRHSLAALPIVRAHNNAVVQINLLSNLAGTYRELGDHQQALRYHRDLDDLTLRLDAEIHRAEGLISYGDTLAALDRPADARELWTTARDILERHGHSLADAARQRLDPPPGPTGKPSPRAVAHAPAGRSTGGRFVVPPGRGAGRTATGSI